MAIGVGAALAGPAGAAPASRLPIVAVPYYTPQSYAQGLQQHWLGPRAAEFAARSTQLAASLRGLCDGPAPSSARSPELLAAREQWGLTVGAWERLSTVAVGPVLAQRSARQIDFSPTRPELITRAVASMSSAPSPVTASASGEDSAMERIGTPAKGLPALEWLLWTRPVSAGTAECRYAQRVAADIVREAAALQAASPASTGDADEDDGSGALLGETLNQWLAGAEALRGRHMERPLRGTGGAGRDAAAFPRQASGLSPASWAHQWEALRRLAVAGREAPPRPGAGLVPFETYLRGLGQNPLADRLADAAGRVDACLRGLKVTDRRGIHQAALALGQIKQLVEGDVAAALKVSVGFSDADGD